MRLALIPIGLLAILVAGVGCATRRPVLYPNQHLADVGPEVAAADIDACIHLAEQYGLGGRRGRRVAGRTAEGAAVGGAAGAAAGAVWDHPGRGAGAGAAGGAAGGFVRGILRGRDPDPLHKSFVEHCLRHEGYEVLGWR